MPSERVAAVTKRIDRWNEAQQSGGPMSAFLREQGLTHIYVGARNSTPLRERVARDVALACVYNEGGVQIYALR